MIQIDLSWDLSATMSQLNSNNEKLTTKIIGRFNPNSVTPEKISTLAIMFVNRFTTNSYTDSILTVKKNLSDLEEEEQWFNPNHTVMN